MARRLDNRRSGQRVRFAPEPDPEPERMSSWLERQASSHNAQLAFAAIASGAAVAGIIYGSQAVRRKAAVEELKASIPELSDSHHADVVGYYLALCLLQHSLQAL